MTDQIPVEKLVKVYLKMKDKHATLLHEFQEQEKTIKAQMAKIKEALLKHCKETGVESVRTTEGLFFRTVKSTYWTSDWESMNKFILAHQVPELLEKKLHQGNTKQFLEEHPELLPPGLNVDSTYSVTIRRK
jgi:hypothetical protein